MVSESDSPAQMPPWAWDVVGASAARGMTEFTDQLAQVIRTVDGDHSLGAGALAEKILADDDLMQAIALKWIQTGSAIVAMLVREHLESKHPDAWKDLMIHASKYVGGR